MILLMGKITSLLFQTKTPKMLSQVKKEMIEFNSKYI